MTRLLYPVPDPRFPFLGVHFTPRHDGAVWAGPNAVLALAREGYKRTDIDLRDLAGTLTFRGFQRLAARFWRMGAAEMWRDLSKRAYVREMQRYLPDLRADQVRFGPSGVRAQAVGARRDDGRRLQPRRERPAPPRPQCPVTGGHVEPGDRPDAGRDGGRTVRARLTPPGRSLRPGRGPVARSASRSSMPSMPTESRTSEGSTSSSDPATEVWVIAAGISTSDSTPPSDSARVNQRVASANAVARSAAPRSWRPPGAGTNETIPPRPG